MSNQDGSSFALKKALSEVSCGRFTTVEPAAVEVHTTYSGFSDELREMQIAADSEEERQFLPEPETLTGRLLLADRGYPSTAYFDEVAKHSGSFIVRLSRGHNPWVRAAWLVGAIHAAHVGPAVAVHRQHTARRMDLDVEYERGKQTLGFRAVVLPGNEPSMTRLCTNLPRTPFSLDLISRLYRFRWQVERLCKEWKSYANLHKFNTANEHIAAGLIWASLCAGVLKRFLAHAAQLIGGKPISTRRVAMCAGYIIDELVAGVPGLRQPGHRVPRRDRVPDRQRTPRGPRSRSQGRALPEWSGHRRSTPLT